MLYARGEELAMVLSEYRTLLWHMEWADSLIWKTVLSVAAVQQDQPTRERLHHFHSTQWAYLQIWRGELIRIPDLATFADLQSLGVWARDYHRELATYADALQDATLQRTIEFPWAAQLSKRFGSVAPATLAETILQIVLHTTHHRAQVATGLRAVGSEPPMMDFIAWVWMGRPAAVWGGVEAGEQDAAPDGRRTCRLATSAER
jgi:uncharacterized damage-inducible protein DinB